MIDRSYLPFKSARNYQDVKMQKWMGFFLSEHNAALSRDTSLKNDLSHLALEQKLLFLSQAYAKQVNTHIEVIEKNKRSSLVGTVSTITATAISLKTKTGYTNLAIDAISNIALPEEEDHESTGTSSQ